MYTDCKCNIHYLDSRALRIANEYYIHYNIYIITLSGTCQSCRDIIDNNKIGVCLLYCSGVIFPCVHILQMVLYTINMTHLSGHSNLRLHVIVNTLLNSIY